MSYLTDEVYIRLRGGLPEIVTSAVIGAQLPAAANRLKRWITASRYAVNLTAVDAAVAALTDGETLETADPDPLSDEQRGLREAETCLVMAELIPALNLIYASPGIQVTVATDRGQTTALSPGQQKEMVTSWEARARDAARPYFASQVVAGAKAR